MADKVLLTGGLGFIGHNLAIRLKEAGIETVVFDNYSQNILNPWHKSVVDERIQLIRNLDIPILAGDTRSYENIRNAIKESKATKVVHLSATPSMVISNKDPGTAIDHNLVSTRNILEAIRLEKLPVNQIVYFSTSTVYGDFKGASVTEESPTNPKGIYEAAKLSSELIIRSYHNLMGIGYTMIRPSALYGPRCINNRVTQIFVEKAIKGEKLQIEGDGAEKLDFTFIDDTVEGAYLSLTKEAAMNQVFNITYGNAQSINRLPEILKNHFPTLEVEFIQRDRMKPVRGTLEIDKAKKLLGYSPRVSLDVGYPKYIEWYLNSRFAELAK